jgi:hypothetical protein
MFFTNVKQLIFRSVRHIYHFACGTVILRIKNCGCNEREMFHVIELGAYHHPMVEISPDEISVYTSLERRSE